MSLGKNIKYWRNIQGLKQEELAERSYISSSMIGMIETDKANPSLDTLKKIAEVLRVPISRLLEDNGEDGVIDLTNFENKKVIFRNRELTAMEKQKIQNIIQNALELKETQNQYRTVEHAGRNQNLDVYALRDIIERAVEKAISNGAGAKKTHDDP